MFPHRTVLLKTLLLAAVLSGGLTTGETLATKTIEAKPLTTKTLTHAHKLLPIKLLPQHADKLSSAKSLPPSKQAFSPNTAATKKIRIQQSRPSDPNVAFQQFDPTSQQFDLASQQFGHLLAQSEQTSSPNTAVVPVAAKKQKELRTHQQKILSGDLAFPIIVSISPDLDKKLSAKVNEGMRALYDGKYEASLKIFNALRETVDYHPVSYLYSSVVYYLIFADLKNYKYAPRLEAELKQTIKVGKKWLKKNNTDDAWAQFYIGMAYGLRGLFNASYKNYNRAIADAFRGLKYMRAATEQNKDFYDPFYVTGSYDYLYATYFGFFLNKYEKRRQQDKGIADLKRAFEKGTLANSFAGLALIGVYIRENRFEQGHQVGSHFQNNFPNLLSTYENTGKLYLKSKSPPEIIAFYKKWQEAIAKNSYHTSLSYLISDYNLAATYYEMGDNKQSKETLATLFARKDIDSLVNSKMNPDYLKDYYARSQELFKKLN
ncbi:hypothetical protein COTS27_00795 [Spirochaetota bacterium]|nr:hypothetical protein COTS27_00795 [Spirochaetota bacterium]